MPAALASVSFGFVSVRVRRVLFVLPVARVLVVLIVRFSLVYDSETPLLLTIQLFSSYCIHGSSQNLSRTRTTNHNGRMIL